MNDPAEQENEVGESERPTQADRRHNVHLRNLYLDPNNYRFIDADTYTKVDSESALRDDVQRRTMQLVLGKGAENVKELIDSFRKSGFLPVDQIQVRQVGGGKYLVVEGNRRVAALKYLHSRYESEGMHLGKLDPGVFSRVPVVYYQDADEAHHLVLMGLKHISGNKKWPAINQAELVRDLTEKHGMSAEDICQSISISRKEYNLTLSTLRLIDLYKKSDFGDQFQSEMYSIFREVTRNAALKAWLAWSDKDGTSGKPHNLERLFSWLSHDDMEEETPEDDTSRIDGLRLEPVITRATHVRELARLVNDETALSSLDATRSLTQASLSSELLGRDRVANSISIIGQELTSVFSMVRHLGDRDRLDLKRLANQISGILDAGGGVMEPTRVHTAHLLSGNQRHIQRLHVAHYRKLTDVTFDRLSRINLFAGINNSGKTSILEAVELVTNLNRFKTVSDMICRRGKVRYEDAQADWVFGQIQEWEVEATIGDVKLEISATKETDGPQEQAFYVGTIDTVARFGNDDVGSQTHFFDRYPYSTEGNTRPLLPAQFTSPYSPHAQEELISAYEIALKDGLKDSVINFIRSNVDPKFADVELVKDRFWVKKDQTYMDLDDFGDGIQRIFGICILFASVKDGVLLMDEGESGIHSSLFEKFAEFIHELSLRFNVQVFLTTHSKECIDAFVKASGIPSTDVTGYAIVAREGNPRAVRIDGQRLSELVSSIDFDLRSPA
ncbi:AAA family ATPase [Ralstonia pseudosolanacearum]|uniref:AAA family ATPase n=1 Tax=Ralstonia pseudosolanacearum TaxID=1310165 RepID=UPI00386663C6